MFYIHSGFHICPNCCPNFDTMCILAAGTWVLQNPNLKCRNQLQLTFFQVYIEPFMPRCTQRLYNLPTPGIGEQGVLGTAPWRTEADRADLSGGPPGAERGTGSVGRATRDKDTDRCLNKLSQRQLGLLFIPVAFDLVLRPRPGCLRICRQTMTWFVIWLGERTKLTSSHCQLMVLCGRSVKVDALTNCDTSSHLPLSISVCPLTHRCAPWS